MNQFNNDRFKNYDRSANRSRVSFFRRGSNISNISAMWRLGAAIPSAVRGLTTASVSLVSADNICLNAGVMRMRNGRIIQWLTYDALATSTPRLSIVQPKDIPNTDHIYFEIDINPKNSQVTFWQNDQGMDMGVLPGFVGGAQQAMWNAQVTEDAHLIHGKFTDCAFASAGKWVDADLNNNNSNHSKLKDHHYFEILSANSFAIGDKRSFA